MKNEGILEQNKKIRNSSIELLKIIAIIFIVVSHSVPLYGDTESIAYIDLHLATTNITNLILIILKCLGHIGNVIFIVCSAYFLIDSKRTRKEKIINIIIDSFIISITFLAITLASGFTIPIKDIIKQFFPITFWNNWFIQAYLLFYLAHSFLNVIIKNIDQKQLLRLVIGLLFLYSGIQFLLPGKMEYSNLIGFIMIYFVTGYVKLYMSKFKNNKKANITLLITSFGLNIVLLLVTNILGLKFDMFSNKMLYWNGICNIFYIGIAISLFNLFSNKHFENKFINYCSSLSLLIYMIHANMLFREYIKPIFYETVFQYGHILLWVILEAIVLIVGATLISAIYKETIQKITKKLSKKIGDVLTKYYLKLESKIL